MHDEKLQKKKIELKFLYLKRIGWVTGGKNACRALDYLVCLQRLETLTRWLEREYLKPLQFCTNCKEGLECKIVHANLPRVPLVDNRSIKQFCDGLLERGSCHAWRRSLLDNHLGLRARASVASSLFLFRKVVPCGVLSKSAQLKLSQKYIAKMTSPQDPAPADFLAFVREKTKEIFYPGWDRSWYGAADSFCLPVSSCLEVGMKNSGARGLHASAPLVYRDGSFISSLRNDYLDFVADDELLRRRVSLGNETKVVTIYTGGKNRTVSVFGARRSFLTPLHTILYNFISKQKWLLRGDASVERFADFTHCDGEILVSGDYESATDNLNISVSQAVLDSIRAQSSFVPTQVWDAASDCLRAKFENGKMQERGQLMGSLLSFPLLCLINYLTFKWAIPRDVPVKINGDDIVFRATHKEVSRWVESVQDSGLTLSKGKTLIEKHLFSLNSNFFLARKRGAIEQVPHIRSTCVWNSPDCASAVKGKLEKSVIGMPIVSTSVEVSVLRTCSKWIWRSQRSVTRGLECTVKHSVLKGAGLMERECFYLSLPAEPRPLAPFKRWAYWQMPPGWRSELSTRKGDDVGAQHALVTSTWEPGCQVSDISIESYLRANVEGTLRFVPLQKKFFHMLFKVECQPRYGNFEDFCRTLPSDWRQKAYKERTGVERVWRYKRSATSAVAFTSAGVER